MYVSQRVCFCDIPVELLGLHMLKYSRFGLAFKKTFLVRQGVTPAFYVAADSLVLKKKAEFADSGTVHLGVTQPIPPELTQFNDEEWERRPRAGVLDEEMTNKWDLFYEREKLLADASLPGPVRDHLQRARRQDIVWDSLVFGFVKSFEAAKEDSDPEHFYMEREWTVNDNVEFVIGDITRLIIPREFHERLKGTLPEYAGPVIFAGSS